MPGWVFIVGGSVRVCVCQNGQGHVGMVRMSQDGLEWVGIGDSLT